jgi:hypothetical protein
MSFISAWNVARAFMSAECRLHIPRMHLDLVVPGMHVELGEELGIAQLI